jgi:putative flippase GtrA
VPVCGYYAVPTMRQLIRYGLVGMASNLTAYCVYLIITYLGIEPKLAMTLVYLVGASAGFFGNKNWTFAHRGALTGTASRYALAHLMGYLLNLAILGIFVDHFGYAHQWVQAAAIIIVAGFLFFAFKCFVFAQAVSPDRS